MSSIFPQSDRSGMSGGSDKDDAQLLSLLFSLKSIKNESERRLQEEEERPLTCDANLKTPRRRWGARVQEKGGDFRSWKRIGKEFDYVVVFSLKKRGNLCQEGKTWTWSASYKKEEKEEAISTSSFNKQAKRSEAKQKDHGPISRM